MANRIDRVCVTYGGERNAYRFVVGIPEGKRLHGRPRRRREDKVK
jgi:hypothetical protein